VQFNSQITGQFPEAVRIFARNNIACRTNSTQMWQPVIVSQSLEFLPDHAVVEPNIVSDEDTVAGKLNNVFGDFIKAGRILNHAVIDTGEFGNEIGDGSFGIYEGNEFIDNLFAIVFVDCYFSDFGGFRVSSGGFYIDDGVQH